VNVQNKYKEWAVDLIREDVQKKTLPYAVCMINLEHDFNIGTLIRNANAFGAEEVFYLSDRKKWDRRGAVGTQNYTQVTYLRDLNELYELEKKYDFICIEQTNTSIQLKDFEWPENPLIIFGSESQGISETILSHCDACIEIPMMGSVRSLNVGTASGIVLHDYMIKSA